MNARIGILINFYLVPQIHANTFIRMLNSGKSQNQQVGCNYRNYGSISLTNSQVNEWN